MIWILISFVLLMIFVILDEIPAPKPRVRIIKRRDFDGEWYVPQRRSMTWLWNDIRVPSNDYYRAEFNYGEDKELARFSTRAEAQKWMNWYLEHRGEWWDNNKQ